MFIYMQTNMSSYIQK